MLPTAVTNGSSGGELAVLRALHTHKDGFASRGKYVSAYPVVLQAFTGGWWNAASIYRTWVLGNSTGDRPVWTRKGPLLGREGYPTWMFRTPLWTTHGDDDRTTPQLAVEAVDGFKRMIANGSAIHSATTGQPEVRIDVALHYYNWQKEAYDTRYPAMTPRSGLAAAVALIQSNAAPGTADIGGHVMLFTNARPVWDPRASNVSADSHWNLSDGSRYTCNWTTTSGARQPVPWDSYSYGSVADLGTNWVQQTWAGLIKEHAQISGADAGVDLGGLFSPLYSGWAAKRIGQAEASGRH